MAPSNAQISGDETTVLVRYWAGARAAVGAAEETIPVGAGATVADVVDSVRARHGSDAVQRIIGACSLLIGERPLGVRPPAEVSVSPGDVIDFLPPFAGG